MKIIIIFIVISKVMETLQTKEHEFTVKVLTTFLSFCIFLILYIIYFYLVVYTFHIL